jgi:hypothetical protein
MMSNCILCQLQDAVMEATLACSLPVPVLVGVAELPAYPFLVLCCHFSISFAHVTYL